LSRRWLSPAEGSSDTAYLGGSVARMSGEKRHEPAEELLDPVSETVGAKRMIDRS